jgi:hypothetical protein
MTPKEKAVILVDRYLSETINIDLYVNWHFEMSKRLALIAVDEIINANPSYDDYGGDGWKIIDNTGYWNEVKNEINKLL